MSEMWQGHEDRELRHGNTTTFFDFAADSGGYAGLDLGSGSVVVNPRDGRSPIAAVSASEIVRAMRFNALPGPYSFRIVDAAGVTVYRESGVGPKVCELPSIGTGMHFLVGTTSGVGISKAFVAAGERQ